MYVFRKASIFTISICFTFFFAACGGGGSSVSTGSQGEQFSQVSNADTNIDVLWVIDDSGSMKPGQDALRANINDFINLFYDRGFNFRVAVAATSQYQSGKSAGFKGGVLSSSLSQSQMQTQFSANANVGVSGTGDERGLQSMERVLSSSGNQPFPRSDAHLAVIFLADENDCGSNNASNAAACRAANPVSGFYNYLKTLTGSTDDDLLFSTHSIVVDSNSCKNNGFYGADNPGSPMHGDASLGSRYEEMAGLTGGLELSICSAFGPSMASLADDLASRASQFYLQHEPIVSTIEVKIAGVNGGNPIAKSTSNGWDYNSNSQSISFYGSAIPQQGVSIDVSYVTRFLVN